MIGGIEAAANPDDRVTGWLPPPGAPGVFDLTGLHKSSDPPSRNSSTIQTNLYRPSDFLRGCILSAVQLRKHDFQSSPNARTT